MLVGYFIKEEEIDQKEKDVNSALAFILFLGWFGAHRFYMGRKLSGSFILISVVLTFGQALWIVAPLTLIEFFQLALTADRIKKAKNAQAIVNSSPAPIKPRYVNQPEKVHETKTSVTIYDISKVQPSKIIREPDSLQVPPPPISGEWIKKLELPYERQDLKIPQLRKAIYEVYEQLAEYIDQQLQKRGSSLPKMMKQTSQGQYAYYNNILYTIFCIAEGQVSDHYTGGKNGYNNSFSYKLLSERTNESFKKDIEHYAKQLVTKLPPADDAIMKRYGLTANGLPLTWWDQEGLLREKYPLTEKHIRILNLTPPRNTKLYEITEMRAVIFRHYFKVLAVLHSQLTQTTNWPKHMEKYLRGVFDDNQKYVNNYNGIIILNYILKLCEQAIREQMSYTRPLDVIKERTSLRRTIPREAAAAVLLAINDMAELKLSQDTLEILRRQNPSSWRDDTAGMATKSVLDVIQLLQTYQESEALLKVTKEIIKNHPDPKAQLLVLYASYAKTTQIDEWLEKRLVRLVHPTQEKAFREMVAKNQPLSITLADELMHLQFPSRRRVILDKTKLADAKEDHARAISSVTSYLGEEEASEVPGILFKSEQPVVSHEALFTSSTNSSVLLTDDQTGFIKMILENGNDLNGAMADAYVREHKKMLNGYIQAINKTLYEKFEDQAILQQDGRIMIEEEYRAAIEELI